MQVQIKEQRSSVVPFAVAALTAVVGIGGLILIDFNPKNEVQRSEITMITAAVVDRSGATIIPSEPTKSLVERILGQINSDPRTE